MIRIDENYKYDDIARKLYTLEAEELDKVMTKLELMKKGQYVVWCPLEAQKQKLAAAEVEKKAAAKNYKEMQAQLNAMLNAAKEDPDDEDPIVSAQWVRVEKVLRQHHPSSVLAEGRVTLLKIAVGLMRPLTGVMDSC